MAAAAPPPPPSPPRPPAAAAPPSLFTQTRHAAPESVISVAMPPALAAQIQSLEEWAQANRQDARRDAVRFWMLKVPAILVSAGSGVFAYFKWDGIAVVAGAIAGLCVLIDGLNPGGALRNVHQRAFNELRKLQDTMSSEWQVGELRGKAPNLLAAEIIENAANEKDRINAYITSAETSLATSSQPGPKKTRQNRSS